MKKHLHTNQNSSIRSIIALIVMALVTLTSYSQGWNVGPGGNSLRNSLSPQYGPPQPELLWSGSLTSVIAQQAVTDGIYLAMPRMHNINDVLHGTKIVVHNLLTGDTLWSKDLPVDFPSTDWRNRVSAIHNGVVYATRSGNTNFSYLYALDAENGEILWISEDLTDERTTEGLSFTPDGDLLVGNMYNILLINHLNGKTLWDTERLAYDGGSGLTIFNDRVYSIKNVVNTVRVAAYNLATGEELFVSDALAGGLVQQLGFFLGTDGSIYVPRTQNNPITDSLFALEDAGNTFKRKWSVPIGYTPFATHGVGPDGSIYAYTRNGEIMRLNPTNGDILNTSKVILTGGANQPRMAIDAAGRVFVSNGGFTNGRFYSFNADLSDRWEEAIPSVNVGGPAIGINGTLIVCGVGTNVRAYKGEALPETTFTKVTEGAIVNDGGWCYGMVWADFNNDNFPDLFVTNNDESTGKNNFLYMNNGNGTFEKITEGLVVNDGGSSYAATAIDIDSDENMDLFVANHNENNFLYLGNGDGTFEKVTSGPVVTGGGKSVGCSWADYNLDFNIDLFVTNRDQQNFLYLGSGGTYFTKVLTGEIVTEIANSSGCAWGDYDNDGFPDVYVANSGTASCLYHNNTNESFTKVNEEPFLSDVSSCSGASWGDVDNDGDLDLFVSTGQLGMYVNWFYKNDGDGTFTKITDSPLVNEATWSSGSAFGDYDKDGDLDLAVGGYDGNNLLFKNDGAGNFEKVTDNAFVNDGNYTEGLAWADFDNDGDLDIFAARNNYFGGNNTFYTNDGNNNNWLKIKLTGGGGTWGNIQTLGAKIYLYATIDGQPVKQMRELTAQSGGGQGGQNDIVQFFGLGDATAIDSLVVNFQYYDFRWTDMGINKTLDLLIEFVGIDEQETSAINPVEVFPNPASEQVTFNLAGDIKSEVNLSIYDVQGRLVSMIFNGSLDSENQQITWNLQNASGQKVNPGVYFCRYRIGEVVGVKKIIVSK
jgi:outer membrane protein assembly factor BamB